MREVADSAVAGTIAALSAAFVFLAFHAIVIVPIWWSAGSGVPLALVCGAVIGASLHFFPRRPLLLGCFLFGAYVSASLVHRAAHVLPEWMNVAVAVIVAIAYGMFAGHRMRHTRCGMIAGAAASIAMLAITGGPLTRTSPRALTIGLSLLPVACVYAAAWAVLARAITARSRDSAPLAPPV